MNVLGVYLLNITAESIIPLGPELVRSHLARFPHYPARADTKMPYLNNYIPSFTSRSLINMELRLLARYSVLRGRITILC
jgi:hypothetical protein